MNKKTSHLIIGVGTLAAQVAVRVKRAWRTSSSFSNNARFLAVDTAWDNVAFDELDDREKFLLSGLPVSEIKANPAAYPAFSQNVVTQMEDVGELVAGAMRPTTTHAALVWKYPALESQILVGLQELGALDSEGPAAIWVIGSVASTTGRGILLETLFAARRVVKRQGSYHPIYAVTIDSEGLVPNNLPLSQKLQGSFYRELERADLSSGRNPIPRPHDVPWTFGRPADYVFRFCGATQDGNLESVEELIASVSDWCVTCLLNPVVYQLVSGPKGDRARLLPNVASTDGHPIDERSRYFISSGVSAITLNSGAVSQFVEAERAAGTLRRVLGFKQPNIQNLLRELRLHYEALANEAEEVQLLAKVTGKARELASTWEKGSLEAWPGHVQNAKHNMAKLIEQASAMVGTKMARAGERLKSSIDARVHSFLHQAQAGQSQDALLTSLGLTGAAALLTDAIAQAHAVSEKATAQTNTNVNLADLHRRVDEHLSKLGRFKTLNKGLRDEIIRELETGYAHAVRIVVAQGIQDSVVELRTWLQERLKGVRKAMGVMDQSIKILDQMKAQALATPANGRTLHLLSSEPEMQMAAMEAKLIQPAWVEAATSVLLEKLGNQTYTLIMALANASPDELVRQAVAENAAVAPIAADLTGYFPTAFEARFNRDEDVMEALRWLLTHSKPMGGKVDQMLEHRLPEYVRPAFQRNHGVLVPAKLSAKLTPLLTQLRVPANRIRSVEGLDAIVCVDELLGLPAHAFPYLRLVGAMVAENPAARAATTVAKWGCEWLPAIVNEDPCEGWTGRDYLLAGLATGVLRKVGATAILFSREGGEVPLGNSAAASAALASNGVCNDLKKAMKSALEVDQRNWLELGRAHSVGMEGFTMAEIEDVGNKLFSFRKRLASV